MHLNLQSLFKRIWFGIVSRPQILIGILLIVVLPLLFLYTGQQFLSASKENQDTLLKNRIGLMHDVFASLMAGTGYENTRIQEEIENITRLNPDILKFEVVVLEGDQYVPIASLDRERIGVELQDTRMYRDIPLNFDTSFTIETYRDDERIWQSMRVLRGDNGSVYMIFTETSQASFDEVFERRELLAYFSLGIVYAVVLIIAFWLIRLTDYRYLYLDARKVIEAKELFTNMLTHELRTPLTAIQGYASMIEESDDVGEQKRYASTINASSGRLLGIVNDLLDVARIQSGKLSLKKESLSVYEILLDVVHELQPIADTSKSTIKMQDVSEALFVYADKVRLHQVLVNVLSNSIKYSNEGEITLSAEGKHDTVEIRIKDNGMGISAEDQKKLFAPFFRIQGKTEHITGTGLGMYITRELIEKMEGTIGVESIKGVGTQIVVTLRLAK